MSKRMSRTTSSPNRRKKERRKNEEKIGKYYDGRSGQERQEEIDWGRLAISEFVAIESRKPRG